MGRVGKSSIRGRSINFVIIDDIGDAMSISKDSTFNRNSHEPVFYMAHPIASDDTYDTAQNMDHVVTMFKFFYRTCKLRVIAPYHTIILALEETDSRERIIGLETDLTVVRCVRKLVLVGHKLSSGMQDELHAACETDSVIWNFVGLSRRAILETTEIREHLAGVAARAKNRELGRGDWSFETDQPFGGTNRGILKPLR